MQYPFDRSLVYITSPYGWRTDPIDGQIKFHEACDYASLDGSNIPIFAAMSGQVTHVGTDQYGGLFVVIKTLDDDYFNLYWHFDSYHVTVGQIVREGEQIGLMGTTGWSTGVHLHFAVSLQYPWQVSGGDREQYTIDPEIYFEGIDSGQPPDDDDMMKQSKDNYIFVARRR